jgi:hypothetical protein
MTLSNVLLFIISVWGAVFSLIIAPYIKSKLNTAELEKIKYWAEIAVRFYEDNIKGTGLGEQKKIMVIDFLENKGFSVSESELDMVIDAIVNQLNNTEWFDI